MLRCYTACGWAGTGWSGCAWADQELRLPLVDAGVDQSRHLEQLGRHCGPWTCDAGAEGGEARARRVLHKSHALTRLTDGAMPPKWPAEKL